MRSRKGAAQSAIKFFTGVRQVKSANNPFDMLSDAQINNFYAHRNDAPNTIVDSFNATATSGMGNCDEKGRICYAALIGNPMLNGSHVTLCEAVNYDHVFVIVADAAVAAPLALDTLGVTAMVVDGWTQDWYFPNLGWGAAKWNSLGNTPNPRQLYVRMNIASHNLTNYGHVPLTS
jgi:hypothetical protein